MLLSWARILVQVTIYRRLLIGRDGDKNGRAFYRGMGPVNSEGAIHLDLVFVVKSCQAVFLPCPEGVRLFYTAGQSYPAWSDHVHTAPPDTPPWLPPLLRHYQHSHWHLDNNNNKILIISRLSFCGHKYLKVAYWWPF